ncbi:non-hydrolyzing UDP-N-acetylglucosamine 2-epimerase [Bordetella holmesii]|uniref:UDP-N-acetylglucosamine 2-epimerase n=2 Tax=Bordetella holmesii TaxID=35814 RepID=A0A158M252_9BORD|nr:UDP-N-acetylglucosamine 2-epimerase (non-hydrolyzing) [Bordetella holmesii]AHV93297.1 UDP-N-acetylglucosamine 2-epimerase [Bordetella holmesii ATCC 51541]AIT25998.1 UDP-N-acetylglucosamine 2-epimerase [Bordetella holmesii 44057]EWM44295.1 UDP-N-acetylglucosamine 2-epimerase [Bordetella holmesii 41130]EWM46570.1 UDP-N-acetylglucosamine 2-epimerase [Bordetella holmesii 35009]AMD45084.1 UDP-N-acetylglucosamine 2-epimerase [Bordetella holmesii H558]
MSKKVLTVLGARPQFIKASVVSAAIAAHPGLQEVVVHTGQHFDANMSDVFFEELGMQPPAHHLDIHGGGHGDMTGRMLIELERVMQQEQPDIVLVYGDTNSTLAGALAAAKLHIPVAHVEAGLRSFNMRMPEEINRILTDRVSTWLFTPTDSASRHLQSEGIRGDSVVQVGDVMFDVALHHGRRVTQDGGLLARLGLTAGGYILATIHRAENTDHPERLNVIVNALLALAVERAVVWPLHPRTRGILQRLNLLDALAQRVQLIDPVGYLDMVQLEKYAALIATDSGGVQKEAFFHRVPCVTLRDETEWTELVDAGWNRLAPPTREQDIVDAAERALHETPQDVQPYGDGQAARKIADALA